MDVHAHYFPEPFVKAINEQGGPPGVSFDLWTTLKTVRQSPSVAGHG